jgi:predicted glycogen debranching enzyme
MFFYAIGNDILNDINQGLHKEWLVTNGNGGFASSTLLGCNTRRYHGLLIAALPEGLGRVMTLSKLEESVKIGDKISYLSTNKYLENYIHPRGFLHLRKFEMNPFPKYIFTDESITVTKEIFMIRGANTTVVRYKVLSQFNEPFEFEVNPLLTCRDFHTLQKENDNFCTDVKFEDQVLTIKPCSDFPTIKLRVNNMDFKIQKSWYKRFQMEREKERGLDYIEDLYHPGYYQKEAACCLDVDFIITMEENTDIDVDAEYEKARKRIEELYHSAENDLSDAEENALILAADMHIINRQLKDGTKLDTIIAGYPWFGDWGRDTFISLPGLTLATRRLNEAKNILSFFGCEARNGLIPNCFVDIGTKPSYNTVDASLWYIQAAWEYAEATDDYEFIKEKLYNTCTCILEHYENGTDYRIKMDEDGLINAGEEGVQLTWMDAIVDGQVITPRHGKPVEINALWYNALCIATEFADRLNDKTKADYYKQLAEKVKKSFNEKFWYDREGYLYDNINTGFSDSSIRPNQIFAISLPYPVLEKDRWKPVVNVIHKKLYTPFGLRSLSQDHPRYEGYFGGTLSERDNAYHMGTTWGFLMGPFIEAYLKADDYSEQALEHAKIFMDTWMGNIYTGAIGTLNEVFDGEEPFDAKGCVSQAWTVAEALRIKKILKHHTKNSKQAVS